MPNSSNSNFFFTNNNNNSNINVNNTISSSNTGLISPPTPEIIESNKPQNQLTLTLNTR